MNKVFLLRNTCLVLLTSIAFTSCYHVKNIACFQDSNKYTNGQASMQTPDDYQVKISNDDELQIIISSAINPEAAAPFNLEPIISQNPNSTSVAVGAKYQSYLVDTQGSITIPSLGDVKVSGLTIEQAKAEITNKLKAYLKTPIVTLRLLSFKVSVLGEVNSPGPQYYERQKVTILDALSEAKDLSIYARRDSVKLIRDNDGKKQFYVYDLRKSDFMASPYYYLKPNDVIYVVPNKPRQGDADISQAKQYKTSNLISISSIILGTVSSITAIIAISK